MVLPPNSLISCSPRSGDNIQTRQSHVVHLSCSIELYLISSSALIWFVSIRLQFLSTPETAPNTHTHTVMFLVQLDLVFKKRKKKKSGVRLAPFLTINHCPFSVPKYYLPITYRPTYFINVDTLSPTSDCFCRSLIDCEIKHHGFISKTFLCF